MHYEDNGGTAYSRYTLAMQMFVLQYEKRFLMALGWDLQLHRF